jgi:hypothetical protein
MTGNDVYQIAARLDILSKLESRRCLPADYVNRCHGAHALAFPTSPAFGAPEGWIVPRRKNDGRVTTVEVNETSQHPNAHSLIISPPFGVLGDPGTPRHLISGGQSSTGLWSTIFNVIGRPDES